MTESHGKKKEWSARLEKYKDRFWFLRGAMAAITIAGIVPNFIDLSRFEFLRAVWALIYGWNTWMGHLGEIIGHLPFMPIISAMTINVIALTSIFFTPLAVSICARDDKFWENIVKIRDGRTRRLLVRIVPFVIVLTYLPILLWASLVTLSPDKQIYLKVIWVTILLYWTLAYSKWFPGFGRGLLFVLGLLAALTILYWVNLPIFGDAIRNFSDAILGTA